MSSVVSVLSRTPNLVKELQKVLPNVVFHEVKTAEQDTQLKQSNVIVGDYDLLGPHLYNLNNLKFVQGTWAGVETLMPHIKQNKKLNFKIARFSGQHFGRLMSEYVIANIVNHERNLFEVRQKQNNSEWYRTGKILRYRSIFDLSFGILGLGNIGNTIGETLHFMGAKVHGYGRKPSVSDYKDSSYINQYYTKETLPQFLSNCDYVINVLPNTSETNSLLSGDILENCKDKGTVLINIGRGNIITEASLVNALEKQWISAAIIDVFEKEPLRKESPLWQIPQVFITPHVSGMSRPQDVAEQFGENFQRFEQNLPISNLIDIEKGY